MLPTAAQASMGDAHAVPTFGNPLNMWNDRSRGIGFECHINCIRRDTTMTGSTQQHVYCNTTLNHLIPSHGESSPVPVTVLDGRAQPPGDWETHGFELRTHQSAVRDWTDDAQLKDIHYAEMAALAKALTGCDHALVGGHIRRNPAEAAKHEDNGPIEFVHSDFTESYDENIRSFYREPDEEAVQGLASVGIDAATVADARDIMILQFWRNVGERRMDRPIAFCDVTTVDAQQMISIPVDNYADSGRPFDAYAVQPPEQPGANSWYTYPQMADDEVVVFRTFDSRLARSGAPFWTPHSAFADPDVEPGQPARHSIELRATCLFL